MKKFIFFISIIAIIGFSANAQTAYIPNCGDGTVSVINVATNTIATTIAVGSQPNGVSVNPNGSKVYITNQNSNTVSVINSATNTVTATITVGTEPWAFGNFISIYPSGVGIAPNRILSANIDIYPNPASDNITIESPQHAVIEITNIQGQLVKTYTATGKTNIDISTFPSGVYVLEIKTEKGVEVKKFIKE